MRSGRSVGAFRGRRGARPTTAGAGPGRRFGHRPRPWASSRQGRRITDLGPSFRSVFNRIPFSSSGLMVSSHCHLPRAEDGMRHPSPTDSPGEPDLEDLRQPLTPFPRSRREPLRIACPRDTRRAQPWARRRRKSLRPIGTLTPCRCPPPIEPQAYEPPTAAKNPPPDTWHTSGRGVWRSARCLPTPARGTVVGRAWGRQPVPSRQNSKASSDIAPRFRLSIPMLPTRRTLPLCCT